MAVLYARWAALDTELRDGSGAPFRLTRAMVKPKTYGTGIVPVMLQHQVAEDARGRLLGSVLACAVGPDQRIRMVAYVDETSSRMAREAVRAVKMGGVGCSPSWGLLPGSREFALLEVSLVERAAVSDARWTAVDGDLEAAQAAARRLTWGDAKRLKDQAWTAASRVLGEPIEPTPTRAAPVLPDDVVMGFRNRGGGAPTMVRSA